MPIHVSNVALFNPATKKADRVGVKSLDDGARCACSRRTASRWTLNHGQRQETGQARREADKKQAAQQQAKPKKERRRRRKPPPKSTCRRCRAPPALATYYRTRSCPD
jgi:ribosomal protein L24